jgi:hypothetical protein
MTERIDLFSLMVGLGSLSGLCDQTTARVPKEFRLLRQYLQALLARLLHRYIQVGILGFAESVPMPDDYRASFQSGGAGGGELTFICMHPVFDAAYA